MGMQAFRLISSAMSGFALGKPTKNPQAGVAMLLDIGQRLFLDMTSALRNALGHAVLLEIFPGMEAQSGLIFQQLGADPRFAPSTTSKGPTIRKLVPIALRTKIPLRAVGALLRPAARQRIAKMEAYLRQPSTLAPGASASAYLDAFERRITDMVLVARTIIPIGLAGIASSVLGRRLLKRVATPDELQTILRSLPYNPTTEMDLALCALAQQMRADALAAEALRTTPPEQLARAYHAGTLPPVLQEGLAGFLRTYGHRVVAEIDLGLARWSEDPTHILGMLANYLQITQPELAPDAQFERGAQAAQAMTLELKARARRGGWFYSKRIHFLLDRIHELTGTREFPKYCFILLFARCRELLFAAGEALAKAGRLEQAEDIFFLTIPEARAAASGEDMRALVRERRANYAQEMSRRHIPRVLLSDGTEPGDQSETSGADGALRGTPASAGVVTGRARVILDPVGARLEPGEILVAPSTDPGWTPLFLSAGGLVMEMGGSMSHGSVVAREYGIPAVVGVLGATEQLVTGQRITVDGSNGVVVIAPEEQKN
jgi:pyruvate,water dikinase